MPSISYMDSIQSGYNQSQTVGAETKVNGSNLSLQAVQLAESTSSTMLKSAQNTQIDGKTKYIAEDGSVRTLIWTKGMNPPAMPSLNIENKAEETYFVPEETKDAKNGDRKGYVSPYIPNRGWYDVKKSGDADISMCFSVTATNMMHWWIEQNQSNIDKYLEGNPVNQEKLAKIAELKTKNFLQLPTIQTDTGSPLYMRFKTTSAPVAHASRG